ncbi:hypothetical protein ACIQRW_15695 [Streptomyces sp. NPDC091287]|uniref:hypothetical protein n=1 Tax=Streptomyces sp. NPDC091287 TaxID=3365988 RepID=UPI0038308097
MPDRDGAPPRDDSLHHALAALIAGKLGAEVEAVRDPDTGRWTLEWTDGETVEAVERAVRTVGGPEAAPGLHHGLHHGLDYRRRLSESAVALGAVRLATSTDGSGPRPPVDAAAVEAFWRDVRLPSPLTEREALLVYGLIYQVHDDHRRNEAEPEQICHLVRQAGLAMILLRRPEALTPAELLTARYARSHGHPAWRYCLVPMDDARLVRAVHEDRTATAEHLKAALTLAAALPGTPETVTSRLRTRLRCRG